MATTLPVRAARIVARLNTGDLKDATPAEIVDLLDIPNTGLDSVSADKGDAAATLVVGTDEKTALWDTALTADRAVTLSTTGATNGDKFRILRSANATGAFDLNVGTGPLKALEGAGEWCDVEYNGAAWILSSTGLFTGAAAATTVIAASVHRNEVDQTAIVTATWTKLALTTERFDKESKFDSVTNYRWLPGVVGLARVTAAVAWVLASGGGVVQIALYKNGTEFLGQNYVVHATAGIQNMPPLSLLFDIASDTDYFEIWVRQDTGVNQDIDGDSTRTYAMFEMVNN